MSNYLKLYPEKIRAVYSALQDNLSRKIFESRYLFQLTGDAKYLINMHLETKSIGSKKTIPDLFANLTVINKKIIMYGRGKYAIRLFHLLKSMNLETSYFCDSDVSKVGSEYMGIPVISAEQLVSLYKNEYVLISSAYYVEDIYENLKTLGFPMENVFVPGNYNEQYFGEEFLSAVADEIYVDAGCYRGETIKRFIKHCSNNYKRIYGLEPSNENYRVLLDTFSTKDRIILEKSGAWSSETTLTFNDCSSCSSILEIGTSTINVTSIDSLVGEDAVTLIKMDIEGAELEALKGSRNTIVMNKPRLAISIYHNPEDIITIPLYIHELVPQYSFYIRHYAPYPDFNETILYAIMDKNARTNNAPPPPWISVKLLCA